MYGPAVSWNVSFMSAPSHEGGFTVAISRAEDAPGIDIVDPIERRRCTLLTSKAVAPEEGHPDSFLFPVETAVDISTGDLSAPFTGHAFIRDASGAVIDEAANDFEKTYPPGQYSIELTGLIKVYVQLKGEFWLSNGYDGVYIEFPEETRIAIGSRSLHRRPATTVKSTREPSDLLEAISTFGSGLKTVSPERSFPTLRGHPPRLEIGDDLEIPSELSSPMTDVVIELPPTYDHLLPAAPLAYYLGMSLEPGHVPRIVGDGIDHLLTHPEGYEKAVHETLQHVFFLDCVTRTEGSYPVDLLERERLEERVDLPIPELFEASPTERLTAYLDVPHRLVADLLPDWRLAAHVDPEPESIPMLPFLTNDLALITTNGGREIQTGLGTAPAEGEFTRGAGTDVRGASVQESSFVQPTGGPDALDTAWVSDGMPVSATKAILEAYENRLGRQPQEDQIEIAVVCNSKDMEEELEVVDDVYGDHVEMPFGVEVYEELSTEELADLVQQNFNFLHYIGHIDDAGFRCPDGRLDISDIDDIGPEAFFLNACQSYRQGLSLIRSGAIGGIVTLSDVINHGAIRIGKTVAHLLNVGFPLRSALDIAGHQSVVGRQYVVVGDGTLSIVQPPYGTPILCDLKESGDKYALQLDGFGSPPGMGCMCLPYYDENDTFFLAEGKSQTFRFSEEALVEHLALGEDPILFNEEIYWSSDLLGSN